MNENPENTGFKGFLAARPWLIPTCVAVVVLIIALVFGLRGCQSEEPPVTDPATDPTDVTTEPTDPETVPGETQPLVMLPNMEELWNQNPDTAGYIRIDGTKLDYPVMYTPDDEQKYNHMDFNGNYKYAGLPFINVDCSIDPESDNLVIYGHNMKNGTGFSTVIQYRSEKFFQDHPTVFYSTLYEEREYEVVAAFYDKVYFNYDEVFKFYEFIDYENDIQFNEAVEYWKAKSEYDTGVEPQYGDRFLTLVTCSYHEKYGRFVVIARYPGEEPVAEAE